METVIKLLPGANNSLVPLVILKDLEFPFETVQDFEAYCGAGEGVLNDLVPEKVLGVTISPACWNHDEMWARAEPSWADFHYSNSVFMTNINALIQLQSKNWFLKHLRMYWAVTYYNAVDVIGAPIFWGMKREKRTT